MGETLTADTPGIADVKASMNRLHPLRPASGRRSLSPAASTKKHCRTAATGQTRSHSGSTARIHFSREEPEFGYVNVRDHPLTGTGGPVISASPTNPDNEDRSTRGTITVRPGSNDAATVVLPVTTGFAAHGAVRTNGCEMLSNRSSTVSGPGQPDNQAKQDEQQQQQQEEPRTPTGPPPPPANLAGPVNSNGSIALSWEAPEDDSVTGYQVLRRRPSRDEATLLVYLEDTGSTGTTYTGTDTPNGDTYVYRVKAINPAGTGEWSNYVRIVRSNE